MSHVTSSLAVVKDIECLKRALLKFKKLHFKEGKKSYGWYGTFLNDWGEVEKTAKERGIDPSQYGKCDHVIELEGCNYSIGVTKREDGTGYSLVWDIWGQGSQISNYIGNDAEKLMTEYNHEYTNTHAKDYGLMVNETEDNEYIYMELTS